MRFCTFRTRRDVALLGLVCVLLSTPVEAQDVCPQHDLISVGGDHALSVSSEGWVVGWGAANRGQLGAEADSYLLSPTHVRSGGGGLVGPVRALAAGATFSLVVLDDGSVVSFGGNEHGQLGRSPGDSSRPALVQGLEGAQVLQGVVDVAAGSAHSVALLEDGRVVTWGSNERGQLGVGQVSPLSPQPQVVLSPDGVTPLQGIVAIRAGGWFTLAVDQDGTLWSWGAGERGQLGHGRYEDAPLPDVVRTDEGDLLTVYGDDVAAGGWHALALDPTGETWSWGEGSSGQLGSGDRSWSAVARRVPGLGGAGFLPPGLAVAAGGFHSLLLADDAVIGWGRGREGQLGVDGADRELVPLELFSVFALPGDEVHAGRAHSVVRAFPDLLAWGAGTVGQLGDGMGVTSGEAGPVDLAPGVAQPPEPSALQDDPEATPLTLTRTAEGRLQLSFEEVDSVVHVLLGGLLDDAFVPHGLATLAESSASPLSIEDTRYSSFFLMQSRCGNVHSPSGFDSSSVPRPGASAAGDRDADGVANVYDPCPDVPNAEGDPDVDTDEDGVVDVCDNCPEYPNLNQLDANGDGVGDACIRLCLSFEPDWSPLEGGGLVHVTADPDAVLDVVDEIAFGGVSGTELVHENGGLTVRVPDFPVPSNVAVILRSEGRVQEVCGELFTYRRSAGDLHSVDPDRGRQFGGDVVVVRGEALEEPATVTFCGVPATILGWTDETITVETGAYSGSVPQACDLDVTFVGPSSALLLPEAYTYEPVMPDGQFLTGGPRTSPEAGGLNFRITGRDLDQVDSVVFIPTDLGWESQACEVQVQSSELVTGIVPSYFPPGGPFPADSEIFVESVVGLDPSTVVSEDGGPLFSYYGNPELIAAETLGGSSVVTPGDAEITVVGVNFKPVDDVFVGRVLVVNAGAMPGLGPREYIESVPFVVHSDNELTFTFPTATAPPDAYSIEIETPNQQAFCADPWFYSLIRPLAWNTAPVVDEVEPTIASFLGETELTLRGQFDADVDAVFVGGVNTTILSQSADELVIKLAGVAEDLADGSTSDIAVVNDIGEAGFLNSVFRYVPWPDVTQVSTEHCGLRNFPGTGPLGLKAGRTIRIHGDDFLDLGPYLRVFFDDELAGYEMMPTFVSDTELLVEVADFPLGGFVDVMVAVIFPEPPTGPTDSTLRGVLEACATRQDDPSVSSLLPDSGDVGEFVTIEGRFMVDADGTLPTVRFDGAASPSITGNALSLDVEVPAGTGSVEVTLETCQGMAAVGTFEYVP